MPNVAEAWVRAMVPRNWLTRFTRLAAATRTISSGWLTAATSQSTPRLLCLLDLVRRLNRQAASCLGACRMLGCLDTQPRYSHCCPHFLGRYVPQSIYFLRTQNKCVARWAQSG